MPYVNGQRTYTNPMNDPNSSRYWNRGGQGAPSFPGAGQTGPGYGQPLMPSSSGHMPTLSPFGGSMDNSNGQLPPPNLGYAQPGLGNPMGVTGWQSGAQPGMSPQIDPRMIQEQMRRRQLQQQSQAGQVNPYEQGMTQPFPATNPWQQRIPQNFNQGSAYGPFTRSW